MTMSRVIRPCVDTHLLIYESVAWSPSEYGIITAHAVGSGLRVDREEAKLIHLGQFWSDGRGFPRDGLVGPWQCG